MSGSIDLIQSAIVSCDDEVSIVLEAASARNNEEVGSSIESVICVGCILSSDEGGNQALEFLDIFYCNLIVYSL